MSQITQERPILGGTDGFRDEATLEQGPGKMNTETIAGLSYALIRHQQELGIDGPVIVARDTRRSGEALSNAAAIAALSAGVEKVYYDGVLPTPAAQKHAELVGAMATIVITASHNPEKDNGWKGMLGNRKPSRDEVRAISDRYWDQVDRGSRTYHVDSSNGRIHRSAGGGREIRRAYIDLVVSDIESQFGQLPLSGKLFVVDGANGAASQVTPEVFRNLGADVQTIATGEFGKINDGYGAADLSGLKKFLASRPDITTDPRFVGAVANDGDGDRVMGVGATLGGGLVELSGNHVMEAMAMNPNQPGIVGTLYTNSGVRRRLAENSIGFEECDNGDVYVTRMLRDKQSTDRGWHRGGEFTGHIIDTDWLCSGDGVRTAAWLAALASSTGRSFGEMHEQMAMWPEVMSKVSLPRGVRLDIDESRLIRRALSRVYDLGARPIVRASGTEPIVRVWTEAPDTTLADEANELLKQSVIDSLS